jgi:hypothetical protein
VVVDDPIGPASEDDEPEIPMSTPLISAAIARGVSAATISEVRRDGGGVTIAESSALRGWPQTVQNFRFAATGWPLGQRFINTDSVDTKGSNQASDCR